MNVRNPTDYSAVFVSLDMLMAAALPQMKLYAEIGRLVSGRPEKGAAVAAAEYLCGAYPDASGFSPRNLRRMRDFYRTYENAPETLAQAMTIGWTQNVVILEATLTPQERAWYIRAAGRFGWSKLELQRKITANAHMDSALNFSNIACYTEESSAVAEPQKAWQEGNTMAGKPKIRGARVHNPQNIDVDVPLGRIVGIGGVPGSGKSSLALGALYSEGSRRYLDSLSTYTHRWMIQTAKAQVDEALYVPATLAFRQRRRFQKSVAPSIPGRNCSTTYASCSHTYQATAAAMGTMFPHTSGGCRAGTGVSYVRGALLRTFCGGTGFQQSGCLPHLRWDWNGADSVSRYVDARQLPDH